MTTEEQFEKIGNDAIQQASDVHCSVEEYQYGLRGIIEEMNVALTASLEMDG